MSDEVAMKRLLAAGERLKEQYKKDAVAGPLDEAGDKARRTAAIKHSMVDDLFREIDVERYKK